MSNAKKLYTACQTGDLESVKMLLAAEPGLLNASICSVGATPLYVAAEFGQKAIVEHLLQQKADPNQAMNSAKKPVNKTPLHAAASKGRADIVALLLQYDADQTRTDHNDKTPLDIANLKQHPGVVGVLSKYRVEPHAASGAIGGPLVVDLPDGGGDEQKNDEGVARAPDSEKFYTACRKGDLEQVRVILNAHPELLNAPVCATGATPLYVAAEFGQKAIVEYFLQQKADPNKAMNSDKKPVNKTPLHVAASRGRTDIVELLLQYHADQTRTDHKGKTPFDIASFKKREEVVRVLSAYRVEPHAASGAIGGPLVVDLSDDGGDEEKNLSDLNSSPDTAPPGAPRVTSDDSDAEEHSSRPPASPVVAAGDGGNSPSRMFAVCRPSASQPPRAAMADILRDPDVDPFSQGSAQSSQDLSPDFFN